MRSGHAEMLDLGDPWCSSSHGLCRRKRRLIQAAVSEGKKQKDKKKRVQDQARKWVTYTEGEEERVEALKLKRKALGV